MEPGKKRAIGTGVAAGLAGILGGIFGGPEGAIAATGGVVEGLSDVLDEEEADRERRRKDSQLFFNELSRQTMSLKASSRSQISTYVDSMVKGADMPISHEQKTTMVDAAWENRQGEMKKENEQAQTALLQDWSNQVNQGRLPSKEQVPPWIKPSPEFDKQLDAFIRDNAPVVKEIQAGKEADRKARERQFQPKEQEFGNLKDTGALLINEINSLRAQLAAMDTGDETNPQVTILQGALVARNAQLKQINDRLMSLQGIGAPEAAPPPPAPPSPPPGTQGLGADRINELEQQAAGPSGSPGQPTVATAEVGAPEGAVKPVSTKADESLILARAKPAITQDELDAMVQGAIQKGKATDRAGAIKLIKRYYGLE